MEAYYGFIREKLEIKILILFILRRLPEPTSLEELTELTMCDGGISYFDFIECIAELVQTGHLQFKDDKYHLTEKGERNGEITENSLPITVRTHAENTTFAKRSQYNRNAMIKTHHTTDQHGNCTVTLSLTDGIGEVVSIELFAVSDKQALALEKGFRKNAESIYNALIEMILE